MHLDSSGVGGVPVPSATSMIKDNAMALMHLQASAASMDESFSPSLVRKAFVSQQPQVFADFVSAAFPTLYFHNRFRAGTDPSFPEYIVRNFGSHPYQDSSVCCLSGVYLAHLTKDPRLLRASRQMYAMALRGVIKALDTDEALSDDMLSTVMMLSVYEMYARTSKDAWARHADGVKRLMLSRGVKAHETGFGRSCYIAFRGFLIATAFFEGKPCFLDEEEWQQFAVKVREEDSQKPGEWSAFVNISELIFMEIAKCPRHLSEARAITLSSPPEEVASLVQRIRGTRSKLIVLIDELTSCIAAHSQRTHGFVYRPSNFVGPVPEVFPETSPSLLLRGANSTVAALDQLLRTIRVDSPENDTNSSSRVEEIPSPTPSADFGSQSSSSSGSSPQTISTVHETPQTFSLPFRIVSEIGRGPSKTSDKTDPRAVTWLDRIASSMGMLGTEIVYELRDEDDPSGKGKDAVTAVIEEIED
ncbi:hypothetical protein VTN00DRAFT_4987 [Thermoascus crustaceus]|uniref:uncharacterized protein n=1 Tax=Thermoascus crustaceus TaxID=5088 RepID=UPI003742E83A